MSHHDHHNHPKNEEFVVNQHAKGQQDLLQIWKLQEAPFPHLNPESKDEFIGEPLYLSVDPYLARQTKGDRPIGDVQQSIGLVRVIESNSAEWPVGTVFYGSSIPWKRYNLYNTTKIGPTKVFKKPGQDDTILDKLGLDAALNGLGMPSQTAYYGAIQIGKLGPSDVLVVSGAAGAVGLIVGQIAKKILKVKKVIGIAGGKAKTDYLVNEIGYDAAIDYKEYNTKEKIAAKLREVAGEPITTYFDNTGGFVTDAVFDVIGKNGRIIICGQISSYHNDVTFPNYLSQTIYRELTIQGVAVASHIHQNEKEFYPDLSKWLLEGIIKAPKKLVEGFEKLPQAYEMLYTGENIGKVIVKV